MGFTSRIPTKREFPKISFCTTCKGRIDQLLETLPANLERSQDWPNVEFVILAYGDEEAVEKIKARFPEEIASGKIRLAAVEAEHFQYSHAKNVAHRLATGEILCNLDADNIMEKGYTGWLGNAFTHSDKQINRNLIIRALLEELPFPQVPGCGGRVALSKHLFERIGGYDERISYWGGEDRDICARAVVAGAKFRRNPEELVGKAMNHINSRRFELLAPDDRDASFKAILTSERYRLAFAEQVAPHWTRNTGLKMFTFLPLSDWNNFHYDEQGNFRAIETIEPLSERELEAFMAGQSELTTPRPGLNALANEDAETSKLRVGCAEVSLTTWDAKNRCFGEERIILEPITPPQEKVASRSR